MSQLRPVVQRLPALLYLYLIITAFISLSAPVQASPLKACGHPFYPPVSWVSSGKLTGLAPAVTRQLFAELGYTVQLSAESNWKRCLLEVQQGNADIVVAAYRIPSRENYLSYIDRYLIADTVTFFVNRKNPIKFNQLEDLRDMTVGLLLGDIFGDKLDRFFHQNSHIEYVSRDRQNFEKLALGRIDYMPLGLLSGQLQSRKLGFHDQVMPLETIITTEFYYLAVGRNSNLQQHLPYLNRRLEEMHRDGTIQRLTDQYSLQYLDP